MDTFYSLSSFGTPVALSRQEDGAAPRRQPLPVPRARLVVRATGEQPPPPRGRDLLPWELGEDYNGRAPVGEERVRPQLERRRDGPSEANRVEAVEGRVEQELVRTQSAQSGRSQRHAHAHAHAHAACGRAWYMHMHGICMDICMVNA